MGFEMHFWKCKNWTFCKNPDSTFVAVLVIRPHTCPFIVLIFIFLQTKINFRDFNLKSWSKKSKRDLNLPHIRKGWVLVNLYLACIRIRQVPSYHLNGRSGLSLFFDPTFKRAVCVFGPTSKKMHMCVCLSFIGECVNLSQAKCTTSLVAEGGKTCWNVKVVFKFCLICPLCKCWTATCSGRKSWWGKHDVDIYYY